MIKTDLMDGLFEAIDRSDAEKFSVFLADDVTFRFGNAAPVGGKAQVKEVVGGFFASIKTLRHQIHDTWSVNNAIVCHGMVTYTRHDGSTLTVQFANIFKMKGELIKDYLIFADTSELYK